VRGTWLRRRSPSGDKHLRVNRLHPLFLAVLGILTLLGALVAGCGESSSAGAIQVQLAGSGHPTAPDIRPPEATARYRIEILQPRGSDRVGPIRGYEASGSAEFSCEVPEVPVGGWVLRLSALNAQGQVLAHFQEPVQVNSGSRVRLNGWLRPGPAPEGLLFVANSKGASLTILRLTDAHLEDLPLPQNPQHLFSAQGKIFVTTMTSQMLAVEGVRRTIAVLSAPPGGFDVAGAGRGVVSFPVEGGIRFLEPESGQLSGFFRTGSLARGVSDQVGSTSWVVNPGDRTMTALDVPSMSLGATVPIGVPASQVEQNGTGTRIYAIGGGPGEPSPPFVRVLEPSGVLVRHFTHLLESPAGVLLQDGRAYVTDSLRGELIVYEDSANPSELERVQLGEGAPGQILSDGHRLYVAMASSGEVAVVDLATLKVAGRFRVGLAPLGLALLL